MESPDQLSGLVELGAGVFLLSSMETKLIELLRWSHMFTIHFIFVVGSLRIAVQDAGL